MVIAVWGPPRSGKTTLAIDLAFALSAGGKSVCLISPEEYCELGARLNLRIEADKSLPAACNAQSSLRQLVHAVDELLFVLAVPFDYDAFGEEISQSKAKALLRQAGALFDAVIVDCPAHNGSAVAAWALNCSDRVLIMTGAESAAVLWNRSMRKALAALQEKTVPVCAELSDCFDYRTLFSMLHVTPAIRLPHIPDASIILSQRRTLYEANGKAGKEYSEQMDALSASIVGEEESE